MTYSNLVERLGHMGLATAPILSVLPAGLPDMVEQLSNRGAYGMVFMLSLFAQMRFQKDGGKVNR